MTELSDQIKAIIAQVIPVHDFAIALDFDGVCKLFTEHKHQIMSTLLFLHVSDFQKVPLEEYKKAYGYINFFSEGYAGKARFLCVNALANYLASEKGYPCKLPGLDAALKKLTSDGLKINATNLEPFKDDNDIKRMLRWSEEVDKKVAQLTGIGLTPGIKEYILDSFKDKADFYLVSTATESSIRPSMEQEDIFFIKRYFGQETATKTEALSALANSGYKNVFMFGDSVEDSRASKLAQKQTPENVNLIFVPIIPGDEESCFEKGNSIIKEAVSGNPDAAFNISSELEAKFKGKEAGSQWKID